MTGLIDHPVALFFTLFAVLLIVVEFGYRLGLLTSANADEERHAQIVAALKATTSYRILGQTLELRDRERVLARFESSIAGAPSASPTTAPEVANSSTDEWLGQWNGTEGTYLVIFKNGNKYAVKIRSLDGLATYEGVPTGDGIQFTRDSKSESIHAGSGQETGMKWLMDKKNCLIINAGEGFCRD